ncbi:MAG: serine hydrolase domain-containing protein [Candidatus Thorarchaeota archaeon]|jgi:CubicO group peptidase (beta-lactamase class C family)
MFKESAAAGFNSESLEKMLREQESADLFSGAVLIAKNSVSVFKGAYGLASKRYGVPNQIDTKFNLGSINKIFTKIAITQLIEQEKLAYDDIVGKFLPEFPEEITNHVTINHLLTFTSGLGHYWNKRYEASIGRLRTVDDFIGLFIDDPLSFKPGERREYSNAGHVILGKIIEVVSGLDYYEYVRRNIYRPAGMDSTDHYEIDIPVKNLATGYTREAGFCEGPCLEDTVESRTRRENTFLIGTKGSPAGGGYSTIEDMLRFDIALNDNKLLNPDFTSKIGLTRKNTEGTGNNSIFIAGGAAGVSAFFEKIPSLGYSIIMLSNYDPEDAEMVHKKIRNIVLNNS